MKIVKINIPAWIEYAIILGIARSVFGFETMALIGFVLILNKLSDIESH